MPKKDYAKPKHKVNYKKKRQTARQSSETSFGASALLVTMIGVLGLMITVMLALNKLHLIPGNHNSARHEDSHHVVTVPMTKKATPKQATGPRYDFYTLLPEDNNQPTTKKTKTTPSLTLSHSHHYFLQVASFTTYREADGLRAQLILEGLNPRVEKATAKGKPWYRVMAGPYRSKEKAEAVQGTLKKNRHLNSLLLEKDE